MANILNHRIDFVYIFDVQDGNPNGDPDAGNLPRTDPETGQGFVSDVCLKRKVRNYVQAVKEFKDPYDIFIREKAVLNDLIGQALEDNAVKEKTGGEKVEAARQYMCRHYYDVRTFGAVMSTGKDKANAGQVRGPIQFVFSRSVEPITVCEHSITRMAVTSKEEAEKRQNGDNRTMGRKATVPYALYRCHGFISANLARQTGFTDDDLQLFFEALQNMFDLDRSAARGLMTARRLIVFHHQTELGNAPASSLFDLVHISKKDGSRPARAYSDYEVTVDALPEKYKNKGIEIEEII